MLPVRGRKLVIGTSFATPHVTGHIARIASANPGIRPFQVKSVVRHGRRHAACAAAAAAAAAAAVPTEAGSSDDLKQA
jgi:subtilisin family serine protease